MKKISLIILLTLILGACIHQSETKAIGNERSSIEDTTIYQHSTGHEMQLVDTTLQFQNVEELNKYNNYIYARLDSILLYNKKLSHFENEKIFFDN